MGHLDIRHVQNEMSNMGHLDIPYVQNEMSLPVVYYADLLECISVTRTRLTLSKNNSSKL